MIQRRLNKIKLLGSTPTASVPASSDDENGEENGDENGGDSGDGTSDGASGSIISVSSSHHSIGNNGSGNGNVDNEIKQGMIENNQSHTAN